MSLPFVLGADTLGGGAPVETEDETPPAAAPSRSWSWESLVNVYRLARAEAEQNARTPPPACPNDGEPLKVGPHGELFCPSDGWRPR